MWKRYADIWFAACFAIAAVLIFSGGLVAVAQERRAAPPTFSERDVRGIFFESLDDAFRGQRPTISSIRAASSASTGAASAAAPSATMTASGADANDGAGWAKLISPVSLEDEIKRVKLVYDSVISTPGAFNGGGYLEARVNLSVLAALFGVINKYPGDVRWKDQAAAARDLIARTAFNCKAGSTQVFNEARLRKSDLQDLVSGSGLSAREGDPENDWAMIVDRSPLMSYVEILVEKLKSDSRDPNTAQQNAEALKRNAQLISVVGHILTKEGLDEADDEDYRMLSLSMSEAATAVALAIERGKYDLGVQVGAITQSCDACHEQYR